MPKKRKISGPKLNNTFEVSLQRSHESGAKVRPVLMALDKKWGRYCFPLSYHTVLLLENTEMLYNELIYLINKARQTKVDEQANLRYIDYELVNASFLKGGEYLIAFSLSLEYFSIEILWKLNNLTRQMGRVLDINESWNTTEKLNCIKKVLKHNIDIPQEIGSILERRDIFTHPTFLRIYPTTETDWQNNHVAWVLSGNVHNTYGELEKYLEKVSESFNKYVNENKRQVTLNRLKRGLRAKESLKKTREKKI